MKKIFNRIGGTLIFFGLGFMYLFFGDECLDGDME